MCTAKPTYLSNFIENDVIEHNFSLLHEIDEAASLAKQYIQTSTIVYSYKIK